MNCFTKKYENIINSRIIILKNKLKYPHLRVHNNLNLHLNKIIDIESYTRVLFLLGEPCW